MNCRELTELLMDYVSGELASEHRDLVHEHLDKCPPCVAYVRTYQITIQLTRHLPREPLPPECEKRLRAALGAGGV
jgi:anti-sigma factor RsiW